MDSEFVAADARERVRSVLLSRVSGTNIKCKRRDYYTFGAASGFQIVLMADLFCEPLVAHFQPMVAVCHKQLSQKFRALEDKIYFSDERPRERWKPPNYLHLYGLRGKKNKTFFRYKPLEQAAIEEIEGFKSDTVRFAEVADVSSLQLFLGEKGALHGPAGQIMSLFLDHYTLSEKEYRIKHDESSLPPAQRKFFEASIEELRKNIDAK